jgi:Domain of unknown function (DUF4055)
MPITTTHSDYQKYSKKWTRCRDAVEGEDAIKAAGEKYLPRLSGQEPKLNVAPKSSREGVISAGDKDYAAYKSRAFWYNASARTVEGLSGLIFRKPPIITIPDSLKSLAEDITMSGMSLEEFAEMVTDETITVARGGVLVEYPVVTAEGELTVADVENSGLRPYWSFYPAESITNWRTGRVNNQNILTFLVLKEDYSEDDPDDEFKQKKDEQYRVLDLYENVYRQRIFRKEGKEWQQFEEDIFPQMNGKTLDFIPFEFFGTAANPILVQKSPIQDLVDVNLSHYRTTADLENGAHWTGVPTPIFIGDFISDDDDDVTEVKLGSTTGINLEKDGDAKFLEFTGKGLESLEKRAEKKEQMMAVLGARILAQEKKMVESAETASIHRAGESSVLASIANAISSVLTRLLEITRDWSGSKVSGDVNIELNTDFTPTQMTSQELTAILKAWQSGGISSEEFYWNLQKGELVRSDKSFDDHQEELENQNPALGDIGLDNKEKIIANNE